MEYLVLPREPMPLRQAYGRSFRETISEQNKAALFNPAVRGMSHFFTSVGLTLPQDMTSRLVILNDADFHDVVINVLNYRGTRESIGTGATDARTRYAFINHTRILKFTSHFLGEVGEQGSDPDETLQSIGIHELGHSDTYTEIWQPRNTGALKRHGVFGNSSGPATYVKGINLINEAIIDYIRRESLRSMGLSNPEIDYYEEVPLIDELNARTGSNRYILDATYKAEGLATLEGKLNSLYGPNALHRIATKIGEDKELALDRLIMDGDMETYPYEGTMKLLKSNK